MLFKILGLIVLAFCLYLVDEFIPMWKPIKLALRVAAVLYIVYRLLLIFPPF